MKKYFSLFVIAVSLPLIMWHVCGILPTYDDYTSLQSPWWIQIADDGYIQQDSYRRPFDFLFGCLVGHFPVLYPMLNHLVILLGHTANALLVFALCRRLAGDASKLSGNPAVVGDASKRCNQAMRATNIATLFFFFSPATLGATLACDGLNQTFAQLWGLLALWTYLQAPTNLPWLLCVLMAVLSKENGLAWAVVPPIVAFAFRLTPLRQAARDAGKGIVLALAYFAILYLLIHSGMVGIDYPEEYSETSLMSHLKDLVQLLAYTWVPLDYMSAVYAPSRNLAIVAITALMALPFLLLLAIRFWLAVKAGSPHARCLLLLVACFFILVSPHLITVVSIMHNYAALSIAAIIVAALLSPNSPTPYSSPEGRGAVVNEVSPSGEGWWGPGCLWWGFALFLAAALFTDVHHYIAARESGLLGKRLAMQAIESAKEPVRKALVVSIDDPREPRYSSFCVRPADAFGWGLSVRHYTGYAWKTVISEAKFDHYNPAEVKAVADSALHAGCDAVWVVGHKDDSLQVIVPGMVNGQ